MIKVGVQLASLRMPFKNALQVAARLGADAVEIDARGEIRPRELSRTGVRQLRRMLGDLNLRVSAVSFRTRRGYGVPDDLDRRIDATKQVMQFAHQLGARVVVNQVGRVPENHAGPEWDLLRASLSDLGRYGQHAGAMLAAETGSEEGAHLARLIEALPAGSLAVDLNPGNLIVNGFSAREAAVALASHVQHVHASDGVRDLARGRGLATQLGRGVADFPELIAILEEHQYQGFFTIECPQSDSPVEQIGEAISYLRSL